MYIGYGAMVCPKFIQNIFKHHQNNYNDQQNHIKGNFIV